MSGPGAPRGRKRVRPANRNGALADRPAPWYPDVRQEQVMEHAASTNKKFVRILRIELEDLDEHLHGLIDAYQAKYDTRQETEHVCLENMATLRNEECGVHHFLNLLDRVDPAGFDDLDALTTALRAQFRDAVRAAGLAPCACVYAGRKIEKVAAYVRP
jgi:hypothetical protein